MSWGGLLFRDPILFWMNVVKYTARDKFLYFGGLNSKIDDFMARKPIGLLLDYFFVTYTTLTIARDPRKQWPPRMARNFGGVAKAKVRALLAGSTAISVPAQNFARLASHSCHRMVTGSPGPQLKLKPTISPSK